MKITILYIALFFFSLTAFAQKKLRPEVVGNMVTYRVTIDEKMVNFTGKEVEAMAVNNSIPAPTLIFTEGQNAVIYVTNNMKVETSVHWHGLILPNFQDGVPYLNSPPIGPGKTHKFEFPVKQSGTYWYHSHTGLQEQRGVYGAIIIKPKKKEFEYE
ncbi:MAG: multicopper oxidase domain-containing protein, partial [Flavobacteriaceae bacterium]|nr:multicopper oxidase domain-containing protein [Flavobacteriaceae bacterium]